MGVLVLILGFLVAAIDVVVATLLLKGGVDAALLAEVVQQQPLHAAALAGGPLILGVLAAVASRSSTAVAPAAAEASLEQEVVAPTPPPPTADAALRLLALLQQEARLVDFIQEDIDSYSDEQVGAAVRSIHAGCRKALGERMRLERVLQEEDGASIQVEPGFDPAKIRLTGNVAGTPPFRGTLEHGGWRATAVNLPLPSADADNSILAPAEVEIA